MAGAAAFPDFTSPKVNKWWRNLYKDFLAQGVDGVWNDVNEPQINDTPNKTMPEDNLHRGGGKLPAGTHLQYHNVYGFLMVKASRKVYWMLVQKTSFHSDTFQLPWGTTLCRYMDWRQRFLLGSSKNVSSHVINIGIIRSTV